MAKFYVTYLVKKLDESFKHLNGHVAIASASSVADSGLTPSRINPMTLILVFTASLPDVQH